MNSLTMLFREDISPRNGENKENPLYLSPKKEFATKILREIQPETNTHHVIKQRPVVSPEELKADLLAKLILQTDDKILQKITDIESIPGTQLTPDEVKNLVHHIETHLEENIEKARIDADKAVYIHSEKNGGPPRAYQVSIEGNEVRIFIKLHTKAMKNTPSGDKLRLGKGAEKDVWVALDYTKNKKIAYGKAQVETKDLARFWNEWKYQQRFHVGLGAARFEAKHAKTKTVTKPMRMAFFMPLANRGEMSTFILDRTQYKNLKPDQKKNLYVGAVQFIKMMHDAGIASRDVKAPNFLVHQDPTEKNPDGSPKLRVLIVDHGLSGPANDKITCGSPLYLPPEIVDGYGSFDGKAMDIYDLGLLFWQLSQGHQHLVVGDKDFDLMYALPPWHLDSIDYSKGWIDANEFAANYSDAAPKISYRNRLGQLAFQMTTTEPEDRPSIEKVLRFVEAIDYNLV